MKQSFPIIVILVSISIVICSCTSKSNLKQEQEHEISEKSNPPGYYIEGRVKDVAIDKGLPFKMETIKYGGGIKNNRINMGLIAHLQAKLSWLTSEGDTVFTTVKDGEYFNLNGMMNKIVFTDDYDSSNISAMSKVKFYVLLDEDKAWFDSLSNPTLSVDLPKARVSTPSRNSFDIVINENNVLLHKGIEVEIDDIQALLEKHLAYGGEKYFKIQADAKSQFEMFNRLVAISKDNEFKLIIGSR